MEFWNEPERPAVLLLINLNELFSITGSYLDTESVLPQLNASPHLI